MEDKRTINTGGGDYAEGDIDKRQGVFIEQQHIYYQIVSTSLDPQQQRNRHAMLEKVKTIWISGLLEHSLTVTTRIALNLIEQPDAVVLPLNALVQELNRPAEALPAGTPIIDIFAQMSGALLILGDPGTGKTTLLLELARDLLARAAQDDGHPIPVVFNLSTWATKHPPLKDWLVAELNQRYDVPKKLAQEWVTTDAILPLIDGLDEVAADQRAACADAINTYRQKHGLVPLAVCSRSKDYAALTTKLRLQGAITIQTLDRQQIEAYLDRGGAKLAGVRASLGADPTLLEVLDTPLMLSIATLAYAGTTASELEVSGTAEERRRNLFAAYTNRMFQRRSAITRYSRQQTLHWLSWLASRMMRHSQTVYYIEWMQPVWHPRLGRQGYIIRVSLLSGLVVGLLGGLLGGLLLGIGFGLGFGLHGGLLGGLVGGLLGGLLGGIMSYRAEIQPVDILGWSVGCSADWSLGWASD